MPKKSNDLERDLDPETLGDNPIVSSVEPIKKKRVMSEEQRARQLENLKRGREARKALLEAKAQETAQMIVDTVPKQPKEDLKMKRILEAVGSLSAEQEEESEPDVIVVKKKRAPKKKTIILQEESETEVEDNVQGSAPERRGVVGGQSPPAPKPKRQYKKREPVVEAPKAEPPKPAAPPKPQVVFY